MSQLPLVPQAIRQQPPVLVRLHTKAQSVCRSCGAPLTWYRTLEHNKGMPFDGDPEPLAIDTAVRDGMTIAQFPAAAVHWRTCPQASTWRKKKAATTAARGRATR